MNYLVAEFTLDNSGIFNTNSSVSWEQYNLNVDDFITHSREKFPDAVFMETRSPEHALKQYAMLNDKNGRSVTLYFDLNNKEEIKKYVENNKKDWFFDYSINSKMVEIIEDSVPFDYFMK